MYNTLLQHQQNKSSDKCNMENNNCFYDKLLNGGKTLRNPLKAIVVTLVAASNNVIPTRFQETRRL